MSAYSGPSRVGRNWSANWPLLTQLLSRWPLNGALGLQHISLMQGYTVYGRIWDRFKNTGARDDPDQSCMPSYNIEQGQGPLLTPRIERLGLVGPVRVDPIDGWSALPLVLGNPNEPCNAIG